MQWSDHLDPLFPHYYYTQIMPYRRKKKTYKKRAYRKKGRRTRFKKRGSYGKKKSFANQKVAIFRGLSFLPQKYNCCHVYHDFEFFSSGIAQVNFQYSLLDLINPGFDSPDRAYDGFHQINAIYNQWRVTSVQWSIQSTNDGINPYQLLVLPRQDDEVFTNDAEMAQQPYCKTRMVGSAEGSAATVFLSGNINMSTLGGRKVVFDDPGFTSGISNDSVTPTEVWSLNFLWVNPGSSPEPDLAVAFHLKLTANVTWWDRDIIPQTDPS